MRPRERRETGEQDLFRSRLDQIIDINHPLVRLARTVDWRFLEGRISGSKVSLSTVRLPTGFRLGREVIWRHDATHPLATDTPNPHIRDNGCAPVPRFA
jgi:hypothetical protein